MTISVKNITVLVVESDSESASFIKEILEKSQAQVFIAGNAKEAFQLLMEFDFDICIVDLAMTNIDSLAFLQEALKVWPWLKVVALNENQESKVHSLSEIGDFPVIEKPFTEEQLCREVVKNLEKKKNEGENQSKYENIELARIQYSLRGLRRLMENAMQANTLVESLRSLSLGIGQILPFAVVGVMGSDEEYVIIFNIQKKVSREFISELTRVIHNRFEALTGRRVALEAIRIEKEGLSVQDDGANEIGSNFSVPVITGGELRGIITIATLADTHYTTSDATFMYYTANQLSTVFTAIRHIRNQALRDPMTGLANRLQLDRELESCWNEEIVQGNSLAMVIMDVDHFKTVNDTYGHLVGDNVLRELARILVKNRKENYRIARYGGEEFVIIMPQETEDTAIDYAVSFIEKVRTHVFCSEKTPLKITISVGLSFYNPKKSEHKTSEQLLTEADQAMYRAKRAGRDCLRIWSDNSQEKSSEIEQNSNKNSWRTIYRMKHRGPGIMIIENNPEIYNILTQDNDSEAYRIYYQKDSESALNQLKKNVRDYDLVIADIKAANIEQTNIIQDIHALDETLIVIIITDYNVLDQAMEYLRYGAYDIIQKPCQLKQVTAVIRRSLEYRRTLLENRQYEQHLLEMVRQNSNKLMETMNEIKSSYNFTLEALVGLLDAREKDSGNHSKRVRDLTTLLARRMGIVGTELEDISRGALLHDIGKIGISDRILLKKGKLTEDEWKIMRKHPAIGYQVLKHSNFLKNAAEIVYSHQEKWDGSGYPRGLKGRQICQGARIFAVIDAYDAMRTQRLYQKAKSVIEAVEEIENKSNYQFDPEVVGVFMENYEELEKLLQLLCRE